MGFSSVFLFFVAAASAAEKPLLEKVDWKVAAQTQVSDFEAQLRTAGKDPATYLSLGESHLLSSFNHPVLHRWFQIFADASTTPISTCVEEIGEWLSSSFRAEAEKRSQSFDIRKNNSPYLTDFQACSDSKKKWFTYSGFFHLFPMVKTFPTDFPAYPVGTTPGNTIWEQLPKDRGLLIAAMDVLYVENQASIAVFKDSLTDVVTFRDRVKTLTAARDEMRSGMKFLDPTQYGVAGRVAFVNAAAAGAKVAFPKGAVLAVMEPDARHRNGHGLLMLKALSVLSDSDLLKILKFMEKKSKTQQLSWLYNSRLQAFDPVLDQMKDFNFGGLPGPMEAGYEVLLLTGDRALSVEPTKGLRCYVKGPSARAETPCSDWFLTLP
ncbi:MAG: hypothetical protein JNL01_09650 [Bdellovibrionales bacterium]|nr:hypothetical protein [Bdellovibrionales bacterium]